MDEFGKIQISKVTHLLFRVSNNLDLGSSDSQYQVLSWVWGQREGDLESAVKLCVMILPFSIFAAIWADSWK